MRLNDLRRSSNVEDRRGGGMGGIALGGGGIGVVALAVIYMLLGGNPQDILASQEPAPAAAPGQQGPRADDKLVDFSAAVLGSTEDVWSDIFKERGAAYTPATFVPYDQATRTGCGTGQAAMGPFYCPADQRVYVDMTFYKELQDRFGAPGDFAQAYVLAHEVGHHVQNLMGTSEQVQRARGGADGNAMSVRLELQADCYAGVWANRANAKQQILEPGDIDEGLAAANAVGDDTLQKKTQGRVVPDAFTHGTSAQRVRWFRTGFESGKPESCDTFAAGRL